MKIVAVRIATYSLAMRPFLNHRGSRRGLILGIGVRLGHNDEVRWSYGEASPWPGIHRESIEDVERQLVEIAPSLVGTEFQESCFNIEETCFGWLSISQVLSPLANYCLEHALLNVKLQTEGGESVALLPKSAGLVTLQGKSWQKLHFEVAGLVRAGAQHLKVKVGRDSLDKEAELLRGLVKEFRGLRLRLDANGLLTMSQVEELVVGAEVGQNLAFVEDPDMADDICSRSSMSLAFEPGIEEKFVKPDDFLVIKPSQVGGFSKLAEMAGRHTKDRVILSSAFETGLGIASALMMMSQLGLRREPGFGTYAFLAEDVLLKRLNLLDGNLTYAECLASLARVNTDRLKVLHEFT
jgi:L-alanine-DL-glutamate epimerase-like enolase superfamily enzyme